MVNEERIRQTFEELVRMYAPSKGERAVCDYLKKRMKALGADEIIEDNGGSINGGNSGNLIAKFAANAENLPSIALTGHMDCVECCENIEPVRRDGVYYSNGNTVLGSDDKSGVTAILEGLELIKEKNIPHGKITVIFTVQEESGLGGSKNIETKYIEGIDFGYTLDGDGHAGNVYIEGPAQYTLTFTLHGKASHAGMAPEKGINAISMAASGIAQCPTGRIDEETTCNIGVIEGGIATNIVPETCVVHVEARSRNDEKLERIVKEIIHAFEDGIKSFDGGTMDVVKTKEYEAFRVKENAPMMTLFRKACDNAGFEMKTAVSGGGSDANWFGAKGFPSVLVGVGMADFHTNRENLAEKDLYEAGELVYRLIEAETK